MKYFISKFDKERIVKASKYYYPFEICGLLGFKVIRNRCCLHPFFVKNSAMNPLRDFRIDHNSLRIAIEQLAVRGYKYTGVIHSHPRTYAKPTQADKNFHIAKSLWIIYSVCYDEINLYEWSNSRFHELPLEISNE